MLEKFAYYAACPCQSCHGLLNAYTGGQYGLEKHRQVGRDCTIKMMGGRTCKMRDAQSKKLPVYNTNLCI
jgi:hypothetical protein